MSERAPVKLIVVNKKTWATKEIEVSFGGIVTLGKHEDVDWQATQGMYWRRVDYLEAENARLQVKVEEEKGITDIAIRLMEQVERERDGYKALAERREEALRSLESVTRSYLRYPLEGEEPGYDAKDVLAYCKEARAAIDMKPEKAREKEKGT